MPTLNRRQFVGGLAGAAALVAGPAASHAETGRQGPAAFDLLIRGGEVVDPSINLSGPADVAIAGGRIARVEPGIPVSAARRTLDARGRLVTPGLVDIHVHVYDGVARFGMPADLAGVARGTTTLVDGGSAGATTFPGFRSYVVNQSRTRVLAWLNISAIGLSLSNELAELDFADVAAAVGTIEANRDVIVGVKVRMTPNIEDGRDMEALRRAREAASATEVPLMVHLGGSPSPLGRILDVLRPGDVVTHTLRREGSILDRTGRVIPEAREAAARGVRFDIGHGAGNFSFETAERALADGFRPDVISSDVHQGNAAGPVFDLPTTLSKFLALGLGVRDVIERATIAPARLFGMHERIGTLREGAEADVAVFTLAEGDFQFVDSSGETRRGERSLQPWATFKAGKPYGAINV